MKIEKGDYLSCIGDLGALLVFRVGRIWGIPKAPQTKFVDVERIKVIGGEAIHSDDFRVIGLHHIHDGESSWRKLSSLEALALLSDGE